MSQSRIKIYSAITATGAQAIMSAPGGAPFATYAISVKGTGSAAAAWSVDLEGSLDAVNWTAICTHNANDGSIVWDDGGKATLHVRPNVTSLTLSPATDLKIFVVAVP